MNNKVIDIAALKAIREIKNKLKELGKKKVGFFGKAELAEYKRLKELERLLYQ